MRMAPSSGAVLLPSLLTALLAACGGIEADRGPLSLVDQTPVQVPGAQKSGAAGAGGSTTGGAAGTGTTGGAGSAPRASQACWESQLPAQPQPLQPELPTADSCRIGATATSWSYPGTGGSSSEDDDRGLILGRWATCGAHLGPVAHAGIEFDANARYQLLKTDAEGALVPMDASVAGARGYYYLLGSGQLDVTSDEAESSTSIYFLKFAQGMDTLGFDDDAPEPSMTIYARAPSTSADGADNLPSTSAGRCSMVGTWELPANPNLPGAPAATFSFDDQGNFVAAAAGADLCGGPPAMYGTYRLSPGLFQLTTNVGLGQCAWWFSAAYPTTFDESCTHMTTMEKFDNCTGGRGYFNGTSTLTRQP